MRYRIIGVILSLLSLLVSAVYVFADEGDCAGNERCTEVAEARSIFGLTAEEIAAFPEPDFDTLTVNSRLLHDRRYMQISGDINIHDAPNGAVIRSLPEGFNFITVYNAQDGWIEISPGQWVNGAHLTDSNGVISQFTGVFLPEEMPEYTIAWMLINAYPSKVPGGDPVESNRLHYRYTQVNLYATVEVDGWRWYQIGPDKWVHQTYVAKVEPLERPAEVDTERWVGIDLYEQVLIAYEGDRPIFATLIASGLPRWPTFEGTFNIFFRRPRHNMSWGTPGDDFYYLQEVPWTMFFDEGRALHGAYWHDGFGYRRSHGCVNMSITDAHWLYHWVAEEMGSVSSRDVEVGPIVHVYTTDDYR